MSLLARRLARPPRLISVPQRHARYLSAPTQSTQNNVASSSEPQRPPKNWLTKKLEKNPAAKKTFIKFMNFMGYGSKKQVAGRRAFNMYEKLCIVRPDEDRQFWQDECHLPPTFQSWFTVTNLHVWLLTVRLRALPPPHGMYHIQALIDHFFLDVEDRIRAVLQPASEASSLAPKSYPYTPPTSFYTVANADKRPKGRAPERLVTQQMKIFKEQWQGMGMSFDLGLVKSDEELAAAVWRNLLGARGARGIVYPENAPQDKPYFRRSVNLVGGKVVNVEKLDLEAEETRDDGSGVHDYAPTEADKYVAYPELMATVIDYVRRETARLEALPDEAIIGPGVTGTEGEGIERLKFGPVRRS